MARPANPTAPAALPQTWRNPARPFILWPSVSNRRPPEWPDQGENRVRAYPIAGIILFISCLILTAWLWAPARGADNRAHAFSAATTSPTEATDPHDILSAGG